MFAILVGFIAIWLYKLIFKKQTARLTANIGSQVHNDNEEKDLHEKVLHDEDLHGGSPVDKRDVQGEIMVHDGCCHHSVETKSFDWLHPLLHCLKIALFVLVINIIFGLIIGWIGQENLAKFLIL